MFYSSDVSDVFLSPFSSLMMKKLSCKYYNTRIITHDNGNVQSHDKEEGKLKVLLPPTVVLIHLHMTK